MASIQQLLKNIYDKFDYHNSYEKIINRIDNTKECDIVYETIKNKEESKDEKDSDYLALLGYLYAMKGEKKRAKKLLNRSTKMGNIYAICLLAKSYGNEYIGDIDKSIPLYKKAIKLGNPMAMNIYGEYLLAACDDDKIKMKAYLLYYKAYKITGRMDQFKSHGLIWIDLFELLPLVDKMTKENKKLRKNNKKLEGENLELSLIAPQQIECPGCKQIIEVDVGPVVKQCKENFCENQKLLKK